MPLDSVQMVGSVISLNTLMLIHCYGIPASGDNIFHLNINGSARRMTNGKTFPTINDIKLQNADIFNWIFFSAVITVIGNYYEKLSIFKSQCSRVILHCVLFFIFKPDWN